MSSKGPARCAPVGKTGEDSKKFGPPRIAAALGGAVTALALGRGFEGSARYQPALPAEYLEKCERWVERPVTFPVVRSGAVTSFAATISRHILAVARSFSQFMSSHERSVGSNQ